MARRDHVRRGALDRRVDRRPFGKTRVRPARVDLGRVDAAPEQRFHAPMLFCKGHRRVHIGANAREAFEIAVDKGLRIGPRYPQITRQTPARDAIDDPEIDRLGLPAHVGGHFIKRYVKHFRGRHRVDIEALAKRRLERVDVGDMGQNAQLDLGIIQR